jgi:sulfur relay protein TusB/DsrH
MGGTFLVMALHVLASINSDTLAHCMAGMNSADSLLLLGDGVYVQQSAPQMTACREVTANLYVLAPDHASRLPHLTPAVTAIDYAEWVNLSLTCGPVISWY